MIYDIAILYIKEGYYILINDSNGSQYVFDDDIIKLLGLSKEFYINKLLEYGAHLKYHKLFFKKRSNILKFKNWLENNIYSFIVAKSLKGN